MKTTVLATLSPCSYRTDLRGPDSRAIHHHRPHYHQGHQKLPQNAREEIATAQESTAATPAAAPVKK